MRKGIPLLLRRPRLLIVTALACAAMFVLTGCVTVSQSGGTSNVMFWKRTTDTIERWYNNDCRGAPTDRARCAFFYIRANLCNNMDGASKLYCYAGTDPRYDLQFAFVVDGNPGNPCIGFRIYPGTRVEWGSYNYGQYGCRF